MFHIYQLFLLGCIIFIWFIGISLYIDVQPSHAANPEQFTVLDRIFPLLLPVVPTFVILWFSYVAFKERHMAHNNSNARAVQTPLDENEIQMVVDEWLPLAHDAGLLPIDFNPDEFEAFIAEYESPEFDVAFVDFLHWLNEYSMGEFDIDTFDLEALGTLPRFMIDTWNVEEDAQVYSYLLKEADRISGGSLALKNLKVEENEIGENIDVRLQFNAKGTHYDWTIHTIGKWIDENFVLRLCSLVNLQAEERKLYLSGNEDIVLISLDKTGYDLLIPYLHLELIEGLDLHRPFENRRSPA